jgi:hypothetical protein
MSGRWRDVADDVRVCDSSFWRTAPASSSSTAEYLHTTVYINMKWWGYDIWSGFKKWTHKLRHTHQQKQACCAGGSVEIDAIVCDDVELLDDSNNVCIVEAAYSPQSREVNILTGKLSKFMAYAKTDPYFRNVSHFIPVLAGRHWSNEMTSARAAKQWIVRPSGTGYEVIRALHTVTRRIMK